MAGRAAGGSLRPATRGLIYPLIVFCLALAVRVWFVRHATALPYGDQVSLQHYAANVAAGHYYGTSGAYWPPAFIFLAGLTERFFGIGRDFLAVRLVNAITGAVACAVTADLGRRVLGRPEAGLLAGLLLALYSPAVYYTATFLAASLEVLTFVAVCDAIAAVAESPTTGRLVLTGALLGVATLTKPTQLPLLIPAFIVWGLRGPRGFAWRSAATSAAIVLLLAAVVNVPWTVRNLRVTGSPVVVDVNGGVNFLIAHNPRATGQWMDLGDHNPVLAHGSGHGEPDTAHLALMAGLAYFRTHPLADARQAMDIVRLFWVQPDGDIARYAPGLGRSLRPLGLPLFGFGLVRDAAVLGVLFLIVRRRRGLLVPLVLLGYCAGLSLLFFAPRFRLPAAPLLCIAAVCGGWSLATVLREQWRQTAVAPPD